MNGLESMDFSATKEKERLRVVACGRHTAAYACPVDVLRRIAQGEQAAAGLFGGFDSRFAEACAKVLPLLSSSSVCCLKLLTGPLDLLVRRERDLREILSWAARFTQTGFSREALVLKHCALCEERRDGSPTSHLVEISEWVEGFPLDAALDIGWARHASYEPNEEDLGRIIDALSSVARELAALQRVHPQAAFVHADLKPSNIVMPFDASSEADRVPMRIVDFDTAKLVFGSATPVDTTSTPAYAAPETWGAFGPCFATATSDVFSLGVLAYVLFTGKRAPVMREWERVREASAASGGSAGAVSDASSTRVAEVSREVAAGRLSLLPETPEFREVCAAMPSGVADFIVDCCKADPADRPSVQEAVRRIEELRCLESEG